MELDHTNRSERCLFSIPIHPQGRKFLRFIWCWKSYPFTCLPFSLAAVFTAGAKASDSSHEEQTGALCDTSGRLDDKTRLKAVTSRPRMVKLLESLGFPLNHPKSQISPTQSLIFLGTLSRGNSASRRRSYRQAGKAGKIHLEMSGSFSAAAGQLDLGKMSATMQAVHRRGYDHQMSLSQEDQTTCHSPQ